MAADAMHVVFPWLEPATIGTEPTVDELAALRELAGYDADYDTEPPCEWCQGSGTVTLRFADNTTAPTDCACAAGDQAA